MQHHSNAQADCQQQLAALQKQYVVLQQRYAALQKRHQELAAVLNIEHSAISELDGRESSQQFPQNASAPPDSPCWSNEQRLQLLFEQSPLAVIEWGLDGIITRWNQAAEEMFGYTPAEAVNCHLTETTLVGKADRVEAILNHLLTSAGLYVHIEENTAKDGQLVMCEWHSRLLVETDGQAVGILSIAQDVTGRKQIELQLLQAEKMSSLGQLVAGVAHEINNPVNFIYGNLSHAQEYVMQMLSLIQAFRDRPTATDPELEEFIDDIDLDFIIEDTPKLLSSMRTGASRIREIVGSLRTFSRLDEAEYKDVNIHDGLDSTLTILQYRTKPRPEAPGIRIVKNYGDLPTVECYPGQLNQVFMNILTNAIDALEERDQSRTAAEIQQCPSQITIETEAIAGWVYIRIADNGPGIPPAIKARIFDPFFTTKPTGKGTGLGMSISYQIITEKHQGQLFCTSELGEGAQFTIQIPRHLSPPELLDDLTDSP
ncbi:MAG: ATP-binding protein [Synechococcales bacterium]|nr:ATP-binding protein [Synechococcales bacterium]